MRMRLLVLTTIALPAFTQPVVAPTGARVGPLRGEDTGGYNVMNSFETGYRFRTIDGNSGKYRSDVNFGNGIRLLASSLTVNSKDGHGKYFDELTLTTLGLGNDPFQQANLRISKNKLYQYSLLWREDDYFNPALPVAWGAHAIDTAHRLQDHDLILFPQSAFRLDFGYGRSSQDGPALSTVQLFDSRGNEFPLFSNTRRKQDDYRAGFEARALGFKIVASHGWSYFKEDTTSAATAAETGVNANNGTSLVSFQRAEPYHGSTPSWRLVLFRDQGRRFAMNGRFTYAGGRRQFVLDENAAGLVRGTVNRSLQTIAYGNARRPSLAANLNLNFFATRTLTIASQTSLTDTRIDGDAFYLQTADNLAGTDLVHFQYLGIRTVVNSTDVNWRPRKWLGLYSGYSFSNRRIRSVEQVTFFGEADRVAAEQENTLHDGTLGILLRPVKPLSLNLEGEIGRADRPIYPVSERNYHALGGRARYKLGTLLITGLARSNYNFNSASLTSYSSRSRTWSADASWAPRSWFSFDTAYSKLHLDTVGGIAYFQNFNLVTGEKSIYISNLHHGSAAFRFSIRGKAEIMAGLSRVQDTGDGRQTPAGNGAGSALPAFQAAQTFPLAFTSPMARISVLIRPKLRWNVGYQFYSYGEQFATSYYSAGCGFGAPCSLPSVTQNYRAHTGYTSLLWSF